MPNVPGVNHKRAIKAFEKAGFSTMTDGEHILIIPRANPINGYTMGAIIKGSGMTVKEFKKLL